MPGTIYLLHGDDAYALGEARQKLEAKLVDPAWRDFNVTVLPGDAAGRKLVEALLAIPFGGGHRLVVVKEPAFLASAKGEDPTLADLEKLLEAGLPDHSALLLIATKVDARLKLAKKIMGLATVREFASAKPWQVEERLAPWVESQVGHYKRRISPDAVSALLAATGGDRWRVQREIEKLTTYCPEGQRITTEMVNQLVAGGDVEVFALTDALARKRAGDALVAVNRLLTTDHALKVLAAAVTVMRGWLRLKQLQAQGMGASQIASAIGARSDFKVKKDLEAIRGWTPAELERALGVLLELDLGVKSGAWPPDTHRILWEQAIARMLAPGARVK
jgi:DNA polymerase III subunit delta